MIKKALRATHNALNVSPAEAVNAGWWVAPIGWAKALAGGFLGGVQRLLVQKWMKGNARRPQSVRTMFMSVAWMTVMR